MEDVVVEVDVTVAEAVVDKPHTLAAPKTTSIPLPTPIIKTRPFDLIIEKNCLDAGLHPIVARVIASRPLAPELPILQALSPRLQHLSNPYSMRDIDRAAERVAQAILHGECIGIETDHDCDGQTSHAVIYYNLVHRFMHPPEKIRSYIGHRLTEGYGLSLPVAERILQDDPRPTLIITADNGSADEDRIALLKAANIDVIVTDHHAIPIEGCPKSAFACLNPTQPECYYGDPYIAGCMVAWLLMAATRQALIQQGYLSQNVPTLVDSLDFVAVGTVADCVSMARSVNNRAVVSYGLRLIDQGIKPCWQTLIKLGIVSTPIRAEDLAFKIGPLLNSDGRLSTAFGSVSLLLSETESEASDWIESLKLHNEQRKTIQREIVRQGITLAQKYVSEGYSALSLYLETGHTGVQGIAASRIKDLFGRPTAIFAPKPGKDDYITGSVRGIEGFHVRDALQYVSNKSPELLLAFGGHQGAGGLTLRLRDFETFQNLFEAATRVQLSSEINPLVNLQLNAKLSPQVNPLELNPIIWTEGSLKPKDLSLDLIDALSILEPFGREFETPIFELNAELQDLRAVGDGTHLRATLKIEDKMFQGIWFSARQSANDPLPATIGSYVKVAFSPKENFFRNERKFDIHIVHMQV